MAFTRSGRFTKAHEAVRKDVERAFGVLQAQFHILKNPALTWYASDMYNTVKACVILHNMIVEARITDFKYCARIYLNASSRRSSAGVEGCPNKAIIFICFMIALFFRISFRRDFGKVSLLFKLGGSIHLWHLLRNSQHLIIVNFPMSLSPFFDAALRVLKFGYRSFNPAVFSRTAYI